MGKSQSTLSGNQLQELVDQTHFTDKEILQWHGEFLRDCPSGVLNRNDFKNIYAQVFPFGDTRDFADHVFNVFDESGDDTITFAEFIRALSVTARGTVEEKIDWAFKLYDLDGSGTIEYNEMVRIVQSIFRMVGTARPNDLSGGDGADSPENKVDRIYHMLGKAPTETLTREDFRGTARSNDVVHALTLYDGLV